MGGVRPGNLKTLTHLKLVVKTIVAGKSNAFIIIFSISRYGEMENAVGLNPTGLHRSYRFDSDYRDH